MVEQLVPLQLRTLLWLFLGYSAVWGGIIFFVLNMRRRQESLERQVSELERTVGGDGG